MWRRLRRGFSWGVSLTVRQKSDQGVMLKLPPSLFILRDIKTCMPYELKKETDLLYKGQRILFYSLRHFNPTVLMLLIFIILGLIYLFFQNTFNKEIT